MTPISDKIPIFKKKIASFLSKEDGKISKENLIKAGIFVAAISLMAESSTAEIHSHHANSPVNDCDWPDAPANTFAMLHKNSASVTTQGADISATHQHCAGENSHSDHLSNTGHVSGASPCDW